MKRMTLFALLVVLAGRLIGQLNFQERMEIYNLVEGANNQFQNAIREGGELNEMHWKGFNSRFIAGAEHVIDVPFLNSRAESALVNRGADLHLQRKSSSNLSFSELDYLQHWQYTFDRMPSFETQILHIELSPRDVEVIEVFVRRSLNVNSLAVIRGADECVEIAAMQKELSAFYPQILVYEVVNQDGWKVQRVTWSEPDDLPLQRIVQAQNSSLDSPGGFSPWLWNWNCFSDDVKALDIDGDGQFILVSKEPQVVASYDHSSMRNQWQCADADAIPLSSWLSQVESKELTHRVLTFSPARLRFEATLGWEGPPVAVFSARDFSDALKSTQSQSTALDVWFTEKVENQNILTGKRFGIALGKASETWGLEALMMEVETQDADGDVYMRRVHWTGVSQQRSLQSAAFYGGFEHDWVLGASSKSTGNQWAMGLRMLVGGQFSKIQSSSIQGVRSISGYYEELFGVEFTTTGIYDFGTTTEHVQAERQVEWSAFADLGCSGRFTSINSGWGGIAFVGVRGSLMLGAEQQFSVDHAPDLALQNSQLHRITPLFTLGLSKLIMPKTDATCPNPCQP